MKNYDCIIIGDDIYALIIALFLTRKMRDILLINKPSPYKQKTERVSVPYNKSNYLFNYSSESILTGLDASGLTEAFLDDLDLLNDLEYEKLDADYIVTKLGEQKIKSNQFKEFKIYLMRYYPKQIDEIKVFFDDLERHYNNYLEQYLNLLHNNDYTLTSLMVEWGDYSLIELLMSYFSDPTIINEFKTNGFINGLDLNKVSAYNFFANYFTGLKSGFYYITTPLESLREIILKKIKSSTKHSIIDAEITNIVKNGHRVQYIEDNQGNKYLGKYYFVSDHPVEFYNDYFSDLNHHVKKLKQYYPYLEDPIVKRTMYLVFDPKPKDMDINQLIYYYQDNDLDSEKIIKIFNYSMTEKTDTQVGKVCVDFTYDKRKGFNEDNILDKLFLAFPKLKWLDMAISYGEETPYLAMLREKKLRKLSISDLIDYESLNHVNVYDNLYIGGAFIRPESSYYGKIHQAIVTADKIEDGLYFKDEAEEFYYSNEEVMMMLRQNYDDTYFGKREVHVNFHIGKSMYFFRIKGKNIVVHRGRYSNPDLSIYTSNDRLTDLIYKRKPYNEIIQSDFFRWIGDTLTMKAFLKSFNLDDRYAYEMNEVNNTPFKYFGIAYINTFMFMIALSAFLLHFVQGIYIYFPLFVILLSLIIYKRVQVKKTNVFEELILFIILGLAFSSIWIDRINYFGKDHILLAPFMIFLFISVIINKPFVRDSLIFDYSKEFIHTKLFLSITNGLTFIWGFIFLIIIFGPFFSGERHVSVLYNLVFVGLFLTHYYPSIYVNTSIKKR